MGGGFIFYTVIDPDEGLGPAVQMPVWPICRQPPGPLLSREYERLETLDIAVGKRHSWLIELGDGLR